MAVVSEHAPEVLRDYYDVLTGGIEKYGDGAQLAPLLIGDLVFEGPIAGTVAGVEPFLRGVKGFIANVERIDLLQEVLTHDGAATLYDAHMPGGPTRLAEFFTFEGGRIARLRLQYDPADYLAKGGA
ncbi:nuclear transport factor 2 family protein [Nocardia puris]|uniref:Ketosteroid isomerase-like protein n=1 Tax=Nocardia puris TaxID=208602 RepID=A0A366D7Y0_9NOCA|nr:nuclear transport factor 2 family protein [Nocardia puris]MBF6212369.1 nuclear transport factor 2 family protein [Nocardia puris]MBF6366616.1 nuclear transport factor 2 family protein [Nocardia puris]MBF6460958.1 nuclear transport factor 2 family protein [Nocardia puris]RBO85609.1 hypothetical protein DFR74_114152 [Nocardia puris]